MNLEYFVSFFGRVSNTVCDSRHDDNIRALPLLLLQLLMIARSISRHDDYVSLYIAYYSLLHAMLLTCVTVASK